MRHSPNEIDPASDRISKLAVDLAGAVAERSRLNKELLIALANAVGRNERVQQKFRYTVVSRLARIEATVGAIHGFQLALRKWEPAFEEKVERDAKASEEFIARHEMEHGLRMIRYIYGPDEAPTAPGGRRRKWSGWEI
jgi:hypothetical protein